MKNLLFGLGLIILPALNALAQTATVTPSASSYISGGGTITFTVNLTYSGTQSALGLSVGTVPAGWTFGTTAGTNVPQVSSNPGDTGNFDFTYTGTIPGSPVSFTFTANYPAGLTGDQTFSGLNATFRPTGGSPQVVNLADIIIAAPPVAPAFTTHPSGQSLVAGATVTFSVVATGNPPPTIVWQKAGVPLANGGRISGATTSTLQITGLQTSDAGSYRAVATNGVGSSVTSNPATLTVAAASQTITFGALGSQTYGAGTFALTATASSSLAVSYTSSNLAVATVSGSTVTIVGGGTTTITANQAGDANFAAATPVAQVLTVNPAAATVVLGGLNATYNGSPKAATATTTPPGLTVTFTYNASATAPTNVGSYAVVGTISGNNYTGSDTGTLVIAKGSQTITFSALPTKAFNDPAFALAATATSGLAVSYASSDPTVATVSGNNVTIVGQGSTTITASQAGNSNYNAATDVGQTLTVVASSQTITFGILSARTYTDIPFVLGATASSGLAVSYVSSNTAVATVSANTVTIVGAGSTTITASQSGNSNFSAATNVNQTLTVNKAIASVTLAGLAATYDATPKAVSVTTNPPALSVNITYGGSSTIPIGSGNYAVVATVAEANYAGNASGTLVIAKASQTIAFGSLAAKTFGEVAFALGATASSGLTLSYSSSNTAVATVSGGTATIAGGGTTTITASQAGDANFSAATSVPQVLTVNKAVATLALGSLSATYDGGPKAASATTTPPGLTVTFTYDGGATAPTNVGSYLVAGTISSNNYTGTDSGTLVIAKGSQTIVFAALAQKAFNDLPFALTAAASSGLAVTYASSNPSVATVSGSTVTIVSQGTTTITASQIGNANYNAATGVGQTLTIGKANQVISFPAISPRTFPPTTTFSLSATATSGLTISYVSSNSAIVSLSGATATVLGQGVTMITASQSGDANFNAATDVLQAVTIGAPGKSAASVTLGNLNATYDGTPKPVSVTTNPSGLTVNISYNGSGTAPSNVGVYTVIATVVDANYGGTGVGQLTIAKPSQTISFGALSAKTFGDAPFAVSAVASSGLTVSFSSSNPAVATVSGAMVTIVGAGTATITASQSGDETRGPAPDVGQIVTFNKLPATVSLGGLNATFDGTAKNATATTVPVGLPVSITYNGSASAPSAVGSYATTASINHNNYSGSVSGTLVIVNDPQSRATGAYFGNLGANAGTFALFVRANHTAVFLGFARNGRIAIVSHDLVIDASGSFRFTTIATSSAPENVVRLASEQPPVAAAAVEYSISGTIGADGALSGSISGLNLSFAAPAATNSGATQSLAGVYQAGVNGNSATSSTIIGGAGQSYVLTTDGATSDAAAGSIDAAGRLDATSDSGARVVGTLDGPNATISLSVTPTGGGTVTFSGANNDARTDIEKIVNISTRAQTGTSANTLIAGFVVSGTQAKTVLIRAIGPTLGTVFKINGALSAASLEIFRGANSLAVGNDWGAAANTAAIVEASVRVGAFALAPNSRDASLLLNLTPGAYSAVVTGQGGASGVSIVEVYDATVGPISRGERIINISTRAVAGTGDNTLIGGFYINGTVPKRVLIRGVGPSLAQFGVTGVLARPQLVVYSGSAVLAQNAGVGGTPDASAIALASTQAGAFAFIAGSQDAALIINLAPGSYTAAVTGVGGTTGVALIEVYEIP